MVRMISKPGEDVRYRFARPLLFFTIKYRNESRHLAFVNWYQRSGTDSETTLWRFEPEKLNRDKTVRTDVIPVSAIVMPVDIVPLPGSEGTLKGECVFRFYVWNRFVDYVEWDAWFTLARRAREI
jgi:hypothetical protein